ncbi:calcium-binding protein, partial [Rhodobacteraceae bacterium 10Alg 79]|nr:calcium-binding protein [Rhodoalgimonas zhirmunskyi]
ASGDRAYVVAGGGDDGISVFVLTQTGRLIHLQSVANGELPGLGSPEAIAAALVGNEIQILVAGADAAGMAQFAFDVAGQGVSRTGTAAAETLDGTANDDIIAGAAGNDVLRGY